MVIGDRLVVSKIVLVEDFENLFTAHLKWVTTNRPQHAQQPRTLAVFRRCDIFKVLNRPIKDVTVDVVDLVTLWSRPDPRKRDELVAELFVILPHDGIDASTPAVVTMSTGSTHRRGEVWLNFTQHPSIIGENGFVCAVEFTRSATIERFDGGALSYNGAVHQFELFSHFCMVSS